MKFIDAINADPKMKIGCIIIVFLGILQFLISPLQEWNQENLDTIFILKKNIVQKKNTLANENDIEAGLKEVSISLKQASGFFLKGISESSQILLKAQKMIETGAKKLGKSHEVNIKSVQWREATGERIIQAPLVLKVSALPIDFLSFIADIESAKEFYTIDNVTISGRSNHPNLEVSMTVSAYGVK